MVTLAVMLTVAVVAVAQFPRAQPLLPGLRLTLHAVQSNRHLTLRLPPTARVGGHSDFAGHVTAFSGQRVSLYGSRNGGPWRRLAAATIAADGSFSLSLPYSKRGRLRLRLSYPNGDVADGSITVR